MSYSGAGSGGGLKVGGLDRAGNRLTASEGYVQRRLKEVRFSLSQRRSQRGERRV